MRKKILAMILCLLVLPLSVILTACGNAKPESVSISAKTSFEYGDEFTIGDDASFTVKMSKGDDLVVKARDITVTYDSETKKAVAGDFEIDYSAYKANVLGTYDIKVSYTKAENISATYSVSVIAKTFVDEDVTVSAESATYDGKSYSISVSCRVEGAVITYSTDGENYSGTNPSFVNAGEYDVYFKIEKTGYEPPVTGTQKLTIAKKQVTLSWSNVSFDYDGKAHKPTATANGLVAGDECLVTVDGEQTNAGTYTATVTALSNNNYSLPTENLTKEFEISKVQVVAPSVSGTFTYDSTTKRVSITENETSKAFYNQTGTTYAINAGTYTVLFSLNDATNYVWDDGTTANKSLNWTISKADYYSLVWAQENNYSTVYDGTEKEVEIAYLPTGVTAIYTGNKATNAGSYTASANFVYDTTNYNAPTISELNWTISKADLKETDIAIPSVSVSRTVTENQKPNLSYVEISDSHFKWGNPQANLYDVVYDLEKSSGSQISSFTMRAIYTPDDTINYNNLEFYLEIIIINDSKTTLEAYEYSNMSQTDKDIAYTCPVVRYDGDSHSIEVYVSKTYTSGKAENATITYFYASEENYEIDKNSNNKTPIYTSEKPTFVDAGTYVIYFKVELDGANTYQGYATLVINQKEIEFSSSNVVIQNNSSDLTTDKTLDDVQVYLQYSQSLSYRWETPKEYLKLGTQEYKLLIIPEDSNYKGTEVMVSITAIQGMVVKTYTLNGATMSVSLQTEYKTLQMEKGESIVVDFGTILEGYDIYVHLNGNLVKLENNKYTIVCKDEFYVNSYEFIVMTSGDENSRSQVQSITFIPQKPTYIEKFEAVVYSDGNYTENTLSSLSPNNIDGELYSLRLVVSDGMTGEIYIGGKLYTNSLADFEFDCDGEQIVVVIKDKNGNVVGYNEFEICFSLVTRTDDYSTSLVSVAKKGETEQGYEYIIYNTVTIVSKKNSLELEVFDTNRNVWTDATFGDILVTDTLTLYKVLLAEGKYKIYQKFAILGTEPNNNEKSYKTENSNNNISDYSIEASYRTTLEFGVTVHSSDLDSIEASYRTTLEYSNYELDVDGLLDINTLCVYDDNQNEVSGVVYKRIENYLLVKIPVKVSDSLTQTYLVALKIHESAVIDGNISYVYGVANTAYSNVDIKEIETAEIILDASKEVVVFKTLNPASKIYCDNEKFVITSYSGMFIFATQETMEKESVTFTIFSSDGEASETITLYITVNPVKWIEFKPVKVENDVETEGDGKELVQIKFTDSTDAFEGDISLDFMTQSASAIDQKSNYTIFNEDGGAWQEGDGTKYIKINFSGKDDIQIALSMENAENNIFVQNLKGVLLALDETESIAKVDFYVYCESMGFGFNCTLSLIETEPVKTDVKLTLNYTENEEPKSQSWTKSFDVYSDVLIDGDYLTAFEDTELSVGKFEGSNDRFYVDSDTNEIYAYTNDEVGTEKLGTLTYSQNDYVLKSKEDGALQGIEVGTKFVYDTYDKKIYIACVKSTQEQLVALMNTEAIDIEIVGNCKAFNVTQYEGGFVADETEIDGSIPVQIDEFPFVMLKLVYNSGETSEFSVMIIISLIDLSEEL